ncbi:MAG: hypothetical protein ACOC4C_05365 [Fibrobacterota bacterium]
MVSIGTSALLEALFFQNLLHLGPFDQSDVIGFGQLDSQLLGYNRRFAFLYPLSRKIAYRQGYGVVFPCNRSAKKNTKDHNRGGNLIHMVSGNEKLLHIFARQASADAPENKK